MGLTKLKELLSFRSSKNRRNPRDPAKDHPGGKKQTANEANASPSSERSCHVSEDSHRVPTPKSAPNGNQPVQVCPPEEPSRDSPPTFEDNRTTIHELWDVAYEKLRAEDKKLVSDYEAKLCGDLSAGLSSTLSSRVATQDRMQAVLQHKMDEVNQNAWKLKFGSSEVQVEDLVKPVLSVVDWANDYITGALSANTCASLAWGGVSLLLPLFLNPSEQAASMAKGLEYISSLIVQSRMWEDLYFRRYESNTGQQVSQSLSHIVYKDALETLYRQVLRFQVSSYCYYSKEGAFRLGRDMIKWDEWDGLLSKIQEQERVFSAVSESWRDMKYDEECVATEKRHRDAISCWQSIGKDTSGLLHAVLEAQEEKNHNGFLNWLCSIDPSEMYNTARDQHMIGTSDWLVESSEEFKIWKGSPSSLLWLQGKAGSGKSILSSSVVKHLKDQSASDPGIVLAYFFFSFSDPEKQTVAGMLSSLVKQLYASRPDTPQPVKRLDEYKSKGERPDTKTLEDALLATARGFTEVFIIIDALDECPAINGERKKLLASLSRIIAGMPDSAHIFCTSRAEPDIKTTMSAILSPPSRGAIDLTGDQEGLNHDIGLYIDSTFADAAYSSWPDELKAEAKLSLIEKADGMFQYITCQFEALQNLSSISQIRDALQNLPVGLDATYDRLLQNIDQNFYSRVKSLLQWLAYSERVLHLEELAEVFVLHPEQSVIVDGADRLFDREDVLKYISSLIIIEDSENSPYNNHDKSADYGPMVRLAHFTIKEYLMSSRIDEGPARHFSLIEADAHLQIAHACLAYHLQFDYSDFFYSGEFRPPLKAYAIRYWAAHLELVPREAWSSEVECLASRALAMRSKSVTEMTRAFDIHKFPGPVDTPDMDYWKEYRFMIERPQCFTAQLGFLHLTDMLLCEGLGTNGYLTQEDLDLALWVAVYAGPPSIVQLLLDNGSDVNAQSQVFRGALHAAAYRGHVSILELLLDSGADVNALDSHLRSPLQIAASERHLEAVQLLLERGAHLDLPPEQGGSALVYAVSDAAEHSESVACLRFLLDSGANINGQYATEGTALLQAAHNMASKRAHFNLLLERGADVNARGGKYGYPLQAVCTQISRYETRIEDVEILLDMGADVNAQGGKYGTALQAACSGGHGWPSECDIIKLLLDRGADINLLGGKYGTALQAACGRDWIEFAEILLQHGADVNIQGGEYGNALQAACAEGNENIIPQLLSQGADVNAQGGLYGNALEAAAARRLDITTETFELLLREGADINKQSGGRYGTALQAASHMGDINRVSLLLNHGAEVNAVGGQYGTALQASCINQDYNYADDKLEFVALLLAHGANVNAEAGEYGYALQAACFAGRGDIVAFLIEHGANVNAEGGVYGTALQAACVIEELSIARLLIEHGADVHIQGGRFGSAWHAAASAHVLQTREWSGEPDNDMLQLLLDHGVDVNDARGREHPDALSATLNDTDSGEHFYGRLRFLLDRGANGNLDSGKYGSLLQLAFLNKPSTDVGYFLLEHHPNIDVNAEEGVFGFALQAAAYSYRLNSVRLLLDMGADIDARGGKYGSALNAAVIAGYWDVAEILLERGAKPDSQQFSEPDEEWLARVREEDGRGAVERYRKFWGMYEIVTEA